mgnify:CR=1 FL=1
MNANAYNSRKRLDLTLESFGKLLNKFVKIIELNNYVLKFPFQLKPKKFGETVNPERKVDIGQNEIKFNSSPNEQFYFSNLSGNENVDAEWELINRNQNIGITETGSFKTNKINLWGCSHVVSPELYFNIFNDTLYNILH